MTQQCSLKPLIPPSIASKHHGEINYSVMLSFNKQHQVLSSIDHDNPDNESILECIHTLPLLTQATTAVDSCINTLRTNTECFLWHQRLGHPSDSYLYNAHKYIDGVPQFKHSDPVMDYCPVCTRSEQPKTHGGGTTMKATRPWQGLSVDFAFTGRTRTSMKIT